MTNALFISIIGAGMVFVGLILLWFMMDILVRLTSREKAPQPEITAVTEAEESPAPDIALKQQAAAAAVAVAMAQTSIRQAAMKSQNNDSLSPWQGAHRYQQLNPFNALPRRK